jgi:ATP-dependent protease HslVU (ClpYQ) peptidase subunit
VTVIATDGRSMAGDSYTSCGEGQLLATRRKVHRLKDGRIVGAAGPTTDCIRLLKWLDDGGEKPTLGDCVSAVILNLDGTVDWVDNNFTVVSGNLIPYAIGSGGDIALGAMLAGASPEGAVRIAASRQLDCGGDITVLHLEPPLKAVA